ncbi:unannotated protein [freshwater metagenome]|uniref:Unannotated protein n=1 Tax=freshwater metagenome TaxID=449393 RepID=A0A6J7KPV7_9ZZZZ
MKRFLVALIALSTLALAGCSTSVQLVRGTAINIAETATMISLNPDVVTTPSAQHLADEVANLTSEGFYAQDSSGNMVANPGFGIVKVDSTSPLTVTYEIALGRKWSDGQPIDSADLALSFMAAKSLGGVHFYSRRAGNDLQYASVKSVGLRSLTLTFSQPVANWQTALTASTPAHVVAAAAFNGIAASTGKAAVIAALQGVDSAKISELAGAYLSVYDTRGLEMNKSSFVSNGAYSITGLVANKEINLKARTNYQGDFAPVTETVNLKLYGDSMQALNDMNTGKVDIIAAAESGLLKYSDLIGMVQSLSGTTKANTSLRNGATADMVLFNFGAGSAFADSTYGSKKTAAAMLRQAFMNLVPKARIVQNASASTKVNATDSFIYPSNSDYYDSSVGSNGSAGYLLQDVQKASTLVTESGVRAPVDVRVVFDSTNPRSVAQFKAVGLRAASAGFNLIDSSSKAPDSALFAGNFDVFIGPRSLVGVSGAAVSTLVNDRVTRYSDALVTSLLNDYASASKPLDQAKILEKIDARLYASGYGVPLFQVPNLIMYLAKFGSLQVSPFGDSATWGYWTWSVSSN